LNSPLKVPSNFDTLKGMQMTRQIHIQWKSGSAKGYTDVFPISRFAEPVEEAEDTHLVIGPRKGSHSARFVLTVSGLDAHLDYTRFKEFNERHGMESGVMRLRFTNATRSEVAGVWWNGKRRPDSEVRFATINSDEPASAGELAFRSQRASAQVLRRPGQVAFRTAMDRTYGSKCCISGCTVAWALQAAHINPFAKSQSDDPTNGLLLRVDLHALLDANQLGISPTDFRVFLSDEACQWPDYAHMQGKRIATPQPGMERNSPSKSAVATRWSAFVESHGDPTTR
jgi:hypothetical protein